MVRDDGKVATFSVPGQPDRPVALKRRELDELLAEELRHLDPDEVYAEAVQAVCRLKDGGSKGRSAGRRSKGAS